jgi:hypothetical protein
VFNLKMETAMNKSTTTLLACLLFSIGAPAAESKSATTTPNAPAHPLLFREARYDAKISDDEARFTADISVKSSAKQEISQPLAGTNDATGRLTLSSGRSRRVDGMTAQTCAGGC